MGVRRWIPFVGLLAVVPGCGNDLATPAEVADTYVLQTIAGDPLPAIFIEHEFAVTWVLRDTLFLSADGTGWQRSDVRVEAQGEPDRTFTTDVTLTFVTAGDRLEITYECADTASCIAGPHLVGRPVAGGLEFDESLGRTPLVFERVN